MGLFGRKTREMEKTSAKIQGKQQKKVARKF